MKLRIVILAACVAFAPCALLLDAAQAGKTVNNSRSNNYRTGRLPGRCGRIQGRRGRHGSAPELEAQIDGE
jgi:hypothetical protein